MDNNIVGNRFAPTGFELIWYYLLKLIRGETSTIHNVISVVTICDHEPKLLPSLSKIESNDQTWYYLAPKEYTGRVRKRTTETGYWKVTGKHRKIKRGDGVEVGIKITLVYYQGRGSNGVRTPWVIHEHEITSLSVDERTYVACKLMYKGDDYVPFVVGNSSEPNHYVVIDSNNSSISPAIITGSEVEEHVEEENIYGSYVNDHLTMPMNQRVDHSPSYDGSTHFSDNNNLNIMSPVIRTGYEVEQTVHEENFHGFYGNHFTMPINQHVDHSPSHVLDANQLFSNNNNSHNLQLETSYGPNGFMFSSQNNNLNMQQRTPYEDWITWPNLNTSSALFGVGQHQGEETHLDQDVDFDTDMFFVDYDHNVELQAPFLAQEGAGAI